MKKLLFIPLLLMSVLVSSCSSDDNGGSGTPPPPAEQVTKVDYYGEIKIADNILKTRCTVIYDTAAKLCELQFNSIKFAEGMPDVKVRVAGIPCSPGTSVIEFHVPDAVIPEVGFASADSDMSMPGEPNPQFAMENLTGAIAAETLSVSATLAMGELTFKGTVVPTYSGNMNVLANGETEYFTQKDVKCEVETSLDGTSATLYLNGVKFADKMPVLIDLKLENIPCRQYDNRYSFAISEDAVPLVKMGGTYTPMTDFTFSKLEGTVYDSGIISFNGNLTRGYIEYSGERYISFIR